MPSKKVEAVEEASNEVALMGEFDMSVMEEFADEVADDTPMPYVNFSGKTGEWIYGFDNDELTPDTEVFVGATTIKKGYIGWKGGDLVDERMCSIFDKKNTIKEEDLPEIVVEDPMDGWSKQTSVVFVIDGEAYEFKGSSAGTGRLFKRLTNDIIAQYNKPNGKVYCNPIITTGTTSYKHKKFKSTIFNPTYEIIGWCDANGTRQVDAKAVASDS